MLYIYMLYIYMLYIYIYIYIYVCIYTYIIIVGQTNIYIYKSTCKFSVCISENLRWFLHSNNIEDLEKA